MIYLEDSDTEKALFENGEEVLIPIEVTRRDGKLEITTFKKTLGIARNFEKLFSDTPFSEEAIAFLDSNLRDTVSSWGYFTDDINEGHILSYISVQYKPELIKPSTVMLKSVNGYKSLIEYELDEIPNDSEECYFATVTDGKIVSVCEMNTDGVFIGASEINVYTSPEYRGYGYGASNVAAMCRYLKSKGRRVAYTVNYENAPSIALAKKCGFEKIAHTYYYICYKKD